MSSVQMVSLTDAIDIQSFVPFKGQKGFTYRISIVDPGSIAAGYYHYDSELKFVSCNTTDASNPAYCCQALGKRSFRAVIPIFQWSTDRQGALLDSSNPKGEFLYWVVSANKFLSIQKAVKEWGFEEIDISAACEEDQYQKFTIQAIKQNLLLLLKKSNPEAHKAILKKVDPILMQDQLGKKYSTDELRKALGDVDASDTVAADEVLNQGVDMHMFEVSDPGNPDNSNKGNSGN